ncbi:MAG: preprotein translocase subunit YajC [Bacteroidota bacterium]
MIDIIQLIILQAGGGSLIDIFNSTWPLFLIIIVFYFFIIRPQNQKQKEQDTFLEELEKGDEVVTTSGILGRVSKIEDNIITLQVDTKTFLRVTKGSISKELSEATNKKPAEKES